MASFNPKALNFVSRHTLNSLRKLRVLFIIPSITNYFTFLEDISCELQQRGHKVFLASSTKHISDINCYDRPIHGHLKEIDFPRGFEWQKHMLAARQLRDIVDDVKPDLINVHFSAAMFTTALAKQSNWPRTIAMIHGMAYPILTGWKKLTIGTAERWAAKRMDHLVLLNSEDKESLSEYLDPNDISILNSSGLGCDLDKFNLQTIPEEIKIRYHRRLGVRDDDFVYIFVGRQVDFKGFDKVVRAFLGLYEHRKNLKLLLVGAKDNIHPTNLTDEEELRMRDCPGIINIGWKENVHEYLCVADVNVFPSEREGLPVNLMEALALGVPVITSDSRGCNEVVQDGIDGLLLSSNNVEEIKTNMLLLYENRALRNRLSEGALANRSRFDRKRFITAMLELFKTQHALSTQSA